MNLMQTQTVIQSRRRRISHKTESKGCLKYFAFAQYDEIKKRTHYPMNSLFSLNKNLATSYLPLKITLKFLFGMTLPRTWLSITDEREGWVIKKDWIWNPSNSIFYLNKNLATSYLPRKWPSKYFHRNESLRPCSGWERVFSSRLVTKNVVVTISITWD